ncbi:hypothetical protein LZ198_37335 [Myxococcus sp. K15C18031901]|uniref:hypothetical protein n=1 Tax=Myxococcus dinghuensis TaxID=2906761 RepID=UPI0020A82178|nr:hypothetical protein [Myxococcus dinghuensis]MCP3104542.1 hypothetical protein [Myxococcus dinghuensis]
MSASAIPFHVFPVKVIDFSDARMSLALTQNQAGTAQPQLDILLPAGATHRQLRALLHAFSANLELNTPANERWLIHNDCCVGPNHGRIYLELAEGDEAEALRGMLLLDTLRG